LIFIYKDKIVSAIIYCGQNKDLKPNSSWLKFDQLLEEDRKNISTSLH
jgi:hypothetical protein